MSESKTQKPGAVLGVPLNRRCFLQGAFSLAGGMFVAIEASRLLVPDLVFGKDVISKLKPEERMKFLYAVREQCTGCRACEYACSMTHEDGLVRPSVSRIHIKKVKNVIDVPMICWHCEDAPCVKACPTTPQAIVKEKDTNIIKYIDDKTCLGAKCNKCIEACPSGYLRRHPDTGWPIFCDMCGGDPQCVAACKSMAEDTALVLRTAKTGFGVNIAYRNVSSAEAVKGLFQTLYYPNLDGSRR